MSWLLGGLAVLGFAVATLGWLVAAVHAVLLLGHVAPPRTAFSLLFQGFRFFDPATFEPTGARLQRRMIVGMAMFAIGAGLAMIAGIGAAALARSGVAGAGPSATVAP